MISYKNTYQLLSALMIFFLFLSGSCNQTKKHKESNDQKAEFLPSVYFDLDKIKKRGKLVALTDNSSTSYFIYKGHPMGYEYELLQRFAKHIDVELEIKIVEDIDQIFSLLNKGVGDVVAANMTVTKKRAQKVAFSEHHLITKQVLVQRLPDNWRRMPAHQIKRNLIRNPINLINKEIHVRKNSSFYDRLHNLSDEIGGEIDIVEVPGDYETEHLIEMVAKGEILYTVADENVAMLNKTYHQNIDIKTAISFPQRIAWAVRKNAPDLLNSVNLWIKEMRKTSDYFTIYNKYFKSSKAQKARANSDYSSLKGGKISVYDEMIRKQSKKLKWDWRLLASLIYQESHFNPDAKSWAGAFGLMQLLPETAKRFGVDSLSNPHDNLKAGTKYLQWLDDFWKDKISDQTERIKFILASYNVGLGHIIDARRLAIKYDKNPNLWEDNVAHFLVLKSRANYYNDPVVKHGYCRGWEPYNYVKQVLNRYDHYKNVII